MSNVNKVILVGRLGQDPKLAYLPSGNPVAEFTVATSEKYKDKSGEKVETTEWHKVKVFGRSAEFCSNYLTRGRLVYVEGSNKTRKWQDKEGNDRYITEVVVSGPQHSIQGLDKGNDQGQRTPSNAPSNTPSGRAGTPPAFPDEASGMDDVPF